MTLDKKIASLQEKIADLKKRMPAHSAKPFMLQELESLEDELDQLVKLKEINVGEEPSR